MNIQELPVEILDMILMFLVEEDQKTLTGVSRRMRAVAFQVLGRSVHDVRDVLRRLAPMTEVRKPVRISLSVT